MSFDDDGEMNYSTSVRRGKPPSSITKSSTMGPNLLVSTDKKRSRKCVLKLSCRWALSFFFFVIVSTTLVRINYNSGNHHDSQNSNTKAQETRKWKPNGPWDAPPPGLYGEDETGSFENCSQTFTPERWKPVSQPYGSSSLDSDDGNVTVSCHTIYYRAPVAELSKPHSLIVGVLSAASGSGPNRRSYIRSTWAKETSVFFLVAGPWADVKEEYMQYKDMIWINEDEIYLGEQSVLTYKTVSFFAIVQKYALDPKDGGFQYALKTDDDSYVKTKAIQSKIDNSIKEGEKLHYFGHCPQFMVKPLREGDTKKWVMTYQTYPEPMFPLYCQGAGFILSREFIDCAVNNHHISNFRYMPFEDVSVGILAERCGFHSHMVAGVNVFRENTKRERKCVNNGISMTECFKDDPDWPRVPINLFTELLIQHRVDTKEDMFNIHKLLQDRTN